MYTPLNNTITLSIKNPPKDTHEYINFYEPQNNVEYTIAAGYNSTTHQIYFRDRKDLPTFSNFADMHQYIRQHIRANAQYTLTLEYIYDRTYILDGFALAFDSANPDIIYTRRIYNYRREDKETFYLRYSHLTPKDNYPSTTPIIDIFNDITPAINQHYAWTNQQNKNITITDRAIIVSAHLPQHPYIHINIYINTKTQSTPNNIQAVLEISIHHEHVHHVTYTSHPYLHHIATHRLLQRMIAKHAQYVQRITHISMHERINIRHVLKHILHHESAYIRNLMDQAHQLYTQHYVYGYLPKNQETTINIHNT